MFTKVLNISIAIGFLGYVLTLVTAGIIDIMNKIGLL